MTVDYKAELGNPQQLGACWITWERHQRSRSLSEQLQIPLIELSRTGSRSMRYLHNSIATLRLLMRRSYPIVFVQVPSLVLGHLALGCASLFGFRVIADAHNAVIEGAESGPPPLRFLYRMLIRRVSRVIVTNSALAERVAKLGGRSLILPDPVPSFRDHDAARGSFDHVVVISTWAQDEPLDAILKAAALLPQPLFFTITGRPRGAFAAAAANTPRVKMSGYLSDSDYLELLRTARAIVDLTTREDCLVCGAYEALALGRPLIVSDSRALRELLQDGAAFAANEPRAIAEAVGEVCQAEQGWATRCTRRRDAYMVEWQQAADRLLREAELSPATSR